MSSAQTPSKVRPVVPAYVLAAALALGWRALAMPWDFGGLFIQFVATAFGVMVFVAAKQPTRGGFQRAVFYSLFTISSGLWSFEAYYAPQAALPFVISCFVLALVWAVVIFDSGERVRFNLDDAAGSGRDTCILWLGVT